MKQGKLVESAREHNIIGTYFPYSSLNCLQIAWSSLDIVIVGLTLNFISGASLCSWSTITRIRSGSVVDASVLTDGTDVKVGAAAVPIFCGTWTKEDSVSFEFDRGAALSIQSTRWGTYFFSQNSVTYLY